MNQVITSGKVLPVSPPLALGSPRAICSVLVRLHHFTDPLKGGGAVLLFSQAPASIPSHSPFGHLLGELFHKTSALIFCCCFSQIHTTYFILAYFRVKPLKSIPKVAAVILSGIHLPFLFPLRLNSHPLTGFLTIFDFFFS